MQPLLRVASENPSVWDYLTPLHNLTMTAKSGSRAVNDVAWLLPFAFKALWFLFLIPNLIAFIDAVRRPEHRFAGSTGSSKTLWVIALAAGFVFPISWIVAPLYLFLVVLRSGGVSSEERPEKAPTPEPPSRPFK